MTGSVRFLLTKKTHCLDNRQSAQPLLLFALRAYGARGVEYKTAYQTKAVGKAKS